MTYFASAKAEKIAFEVCHIEKNLKITEGVKDVVGFLEKFMTLSDLTFGFSFNKKIPFHALQINMLCFLFVQYIIFKSLFFAKSLPTRNYNKLR